MSIGLSYVPPAGEIAGEQHLAPVKERFSFRVAERLPVNPVQFLLSAGVDIETDS